MFLLVAIGIWGRERCTVQDYLYFLKCSCIPSVLNWQSHTVLISRPKEVALASIAAMTPLSGARVISTVHGWPLPFCHLSDLRFMWSIQHHDISDSSICKLESTITEIDSRSHGCESRVDFTWMERSKSVSVDWYQQVYQLLQAHTELSWLQRDCSRMVHPSIVKHGIPLMRGFYCFDSREYTGDG
jgi:hypothetical protein